MLAQTFARLGGACVAALAAFSAAFSPALAQKTPLTVYTSMENEQLKLFKDEIEKAVPEADIQWLRDTTGVITARVLAEKASPKADIIFGLAASSLLLFNKEGLLENYKPAGEDKLKDAFRSKDGSYVGMDAFLGVICYNTVEGAKDGLTSPASYKDLLNPKFKGKIVMPHPASSGTGYLMVAAWLQTMGDADGWKYMDALHDNIAVYTHSGSAPCVQAAKGERVLGLGYDMRAASEKTKGAPIDIVLPTEGAGWDMEAASIMKGSKNTAISKKVLDWAATKGANELYSKYYAIVAHPEVNNQPKNYPDKADSKMAKIDLQTMANNRDAILAEWTKRYEGKAAPK
jgi:iron(III) transport system substrate-binding protein